MFPHEVVVPAVHPPPGSATLAETDAQVPSPEPVSALLHAAQVALQDEPQQTPFTQ